MVNKELISFTKYEINCPDHVCTEERLCYCAQTGKLCNKIGCPKFRKETEEE